MRDYPRLPIEQFGRQLITTGDLDPLYIGLARMEWDQDQLYRFLIAYWCFYDAGSASYISERKGNVFWNTMHTAARNTVSTPLGGRWPRAAERRHFRGEQATNAVEELTERYKHPEEMVRYIAGPGAPETPVLFQEVAGRAKEHRGFGDWISYKVADMLERLDVARVLFTYSDAMYSSPVKAAEKLARERLQLPEDAKVKPEVVHNVVKHLLVEYQDLWAPPNMANIRQVGLQEIETVLCKWGSHMNGHYPPFKDTTEINEGLHAWSSASETARELLHWMPKKTS